MQKWRMLCKRRTMMSMRGVTIVLAVLGVASAGIAAAYVVFSGDGGFTAPATEQSPNGTTTDEVPSATSSETTP
jgi:hypothetical protein